jgi:HAE1 family hydrophobic/amphiphilic exporter-1
VSLSRMAVGRPVLTTVIIAVFLVMGISSYLGLVVDLFPKVEFPFVTVTTIYPGAGPEEVESQVSKKLEDAVSTLADIRRLDSINQESLSLLLIEFELGVDVDLVAIDVKEKVEGILNELPKEIEKPQVLKFDIGALPIISLSLTGPQPLREIYDVADRVVSDDLSRATGVASVTIVGGQRREIRVALDPAKLAAYGLDATQVSAAIAQQNINVPAGRLERPDEEFTVRVLGEFTDLDDLRRLPVNLPGSGRSVRIEDLGQVLDTTEEARDLAQANGVTAVGLNVVKRTDANTVGTADAIYGRVEALNQRLPEGMKLEILRDESTFIRSTVHDVIVNILLGILLTTIILYLFLHNIRTTVVAALAMPTSIIATFLLIDFGGFTINMMTLLALGISIGVLVSNAIVVLESISTRLEAGDDPATAAQKGTDTVAIAVAATALTNIVVFTPIATMSGIVGQFFVQFGLTVVFATVFSLLVSFTLTPMLASKLLKSRAEQERKLAGHGGFLRRIEAPFLALAKIWERGYLRVETGYRRSVTWSVDHRGRTGLMVMAIFVGSLVLVRFVGGEFMPASDENFVQIMATLPAGSTLEQTKATMEEVRTVVLEDVPETEATLLTVGGENKGVEEGELTIRLSPATERDRSIFQIINEIRPRLAGIPAADIVAQISSGFGDEQDIITEVIGPDLGMVRSLADSLRNRMSQIPGLVDLDVSAKPGKPEIVFRPDRDKMAGRMFTLAQVGGELRGLYEGNEASVYREGGEEYKIRVQLNQEERSRLAALSRVRLSGPGSQVPLTALGDLGRRRGLAEITRKNKERMVSVTANIGSGTLVEKINAIQAQVADMKIPAGYRVEYSGEFERLGETFAEVFKALILAIILTYLVLAAILESFVHPFTIMFTLPLGLVGVAVALFLTGATINLFSLMAIVMLVGIVVNNAILILDNAATLRKEGKNAREAILEASPGRLRPIVMTTLAILAGILPQAIGGAGAAYTVAMAVTTMGGVLASGILALYLIPILYTLFDRFTTQGRRDRAAGAN